MASTAIDNILRDSIRTALADSGIATAAGVLPGTWAAATNAGGRVFDGEAGLIGARNRGRLPFLEFWIRQSHRDLLSNTGGTVTTSVTVRTHVGGGDLKIAEDLAREITYAVVKAVRNVPTNDQCRRGDEQIGEFLQGPWGHALDVTFSFEQTFTRE